MPTQAEFEADKDEATQRLARIRELLMALPGVQERLARMQVPLTVPVGGDDEWLPYATAWNNAFIGNIKGEEIHAATLAWTEIIAAYAEGDTNQFNTSVAAFQAMLERDVPPALANAQVGFEFFFNYSRPFLYALVLYIFGFVLVALAWLSTFLGKFALLNRTAFWLILFTLGLHTFALVARIVISGRPPVTNLYSSAVFIGWAAVVLGLVFERIYRIGIGNAIGAFAGFSTLFIAYGLAADGDTFTVLQAVLDTQFWLATHVVCITLGYSTTFVAGLLGVVYLIVAAIGPLDADKRRGVTKALTSMIYGTLCFALYFSFVGTVLGGLWADDSWGRFWGWDPKENGALIIVLWNALVLHARWGGIVQQRGLAMLAVFGNITTAWSWFGVNELGVGLHSYGFTEGVLRNLGIFVLFQMAIILFGIVTMFLTADPRQPTKA
jgi:ABC-type transport system involved in cytochrome c biogenesis permease subunit